MERLPTYEQLYASFRWNIPARYNIAADVCDRHAADPSKVALIGEAADGKAWQMTFRDVQRKANQLANLFVANARLVSRHSRTHVPRAPLRSRTGLRHDRTPSGAHRAAGADDA